MEALQAEIEEQNKRRDDYLEETEKVKSSLKNILNGLVLILLEIKPKSSREIGPKDIIIALESLLGHVMQLMESIEEEKHKVYRYFVFILN